MQQSLYIMQQTSNMKGAVSYSVGLVVVCLLVLMLLWLPDIIQKD
ncbi:MAG: hypothetical protein QNJ54_04760 [Prochloraceae cyanobacterium]|nr:hypothetical protein [Prochloraceae cyanobacterium]